MRKVFNFGNYYFTLVRDVFVKHKEKPSSWLASSISSARSAAGGRERVEYTWDGCLYASDVANVLEEVFPDIIEYVERVTKGKVSTKKVDVHITEYGSGIDANAFLEVPSWWSEDDIKKYIDEIVSAIDSVACDVEDYVVNEARKRHEEFMREFREGKWERVK